MAAAGNRAHDPQARIWRDSHAYELLRSRMWLMVSGDQAHGQSEFRCLSGTRVIVSIRKT
jgi:hypothetical protein